MFQPANHLGGNPQQDGTPIGPGGCPLHPLIRQQLRMEVDNAQYVVGLMHPHGPPVDQSMDQDQSTRKSIQEEQFVAPEAYHLPHERPGVGRAGWVMATSLADIRPLPIREAILQNRSRTRGPPPGDPFHQEWVEFRRCLDQIGRAHV